MTSQPRDQAGVPIRRGGSTRTALIIVAVTLGACIGVPLTFRIFVVEAFKIPAASGAPNVVIGDHLFVTKYRYWFNEPAPGEIIVFKYPKDETKDFIKRIVAVGGDTVAVDASNRLVINGEPAPRQKLTGPCSYASGDEQTGELVTRPCLAYEERLGRQRYRIIHDPGGFPGPMKEVKVPAGHVFVMGDNRDNSHDSRFWGTVPEGNIKGRASIIWWSSNNKGGIRRDRMFTWLHAD